VGCVLILPIYQSENDSAIDYKNPELTARNRLSPDCVSRTTDPGSGISGARAGGTERVERS